MINLLAYDYFVCVSVEWPTSMSGFTDYLAKSKQGEYGVRESLHMPKPPDYKPERQSPGKGVSEALHGRLSEADRLVLSRMDFRLVFQGSYSIMKLTSSIKWSFVLLAQNPTTSSHSKHIHQLKHH